MIQNSYVKKFIFLPLVLILLQPLQSFSADFPDSKPIVTSISAQKSSVNKITIKWKIPDDFKAASVAVFRGTDKISDFPQILPMKPVADVPAKTTSYVDTPGNFGSYYYALIARDKDGNFFDAVIPGINSTINAVTLENPDKDKKEENPEEAEYRPSYLRNLPLPYLDLVPDIARKPTQFSDEALVAARTISGKYYGKKPPLKEPYVFEEDLVCKPDGDDYYLFQSLKNYFIKKDYKNSASDLRRFLSVNREPYTSARAAFYLAESEYYSRNFKTALQLFLFLDDIFPELSKSWADSTLDLYEIPEK